MARRFGQRLDHVQAQPRGQPRDVVDRLDQVREPGRAGLVVRPVGHRDPAQRAQVGQELGVVEDRGDGLAPARLADEREVADRPGRRSPASAASSREPVEAVAAPGRAVHHQPVRGRRAGRARRLDPSGGSPGHQTVTGRSWMMQRRRDRREVPAGLAAGGDAGSSRRRSRARPRAAARRCASTRASSHDGPSGSADPTIDRPRRMAAGQGLDRRGAVLGDLRPAGDDDQVHHARPGRDVPARDRRPPRPSGPGWPRSGSSSRLDARRCCGPAPTSAGPARPILAGRVDRPSVDLRSGASAARRARAARRPRPVPTSRRRSSGSRGAGASAHASMIGSTMLHASSTSSARVNSEASPWRASRMSVS